MTLDAYSRAGFPAFAAEWQRRHAYQGKPVKLLLPDGASVKGTVAGVDSTGALVLADGPRRARFLSGEISLGARRRVRTRPVGARRPRVACRARRIVYRRAATGRG